MKFWLIGCALLFVSLSFAQKDTIADFSKSTKSDSIRPHSIKKAVVFSAVLPGAGQVYNHIAMPKGKKKAYWKVPLIYAGLGVTGYFGVINHLEQKAIKQEYFSREANNPPSEKYFNYDKTGLVQLQKQRATNRDLLFVGMGLVYLLQIADAAVEAHFVKFDVSENISMLFRPSYQATPFNYQGSVGVSLQLTFK
jgi:hypothetical protein